MSTVIAVEAATLEQSVDQERSRAMTVRLRWLVYITIGILALFTVGSPTLYAGPRQPFFLLRAGMLVLLGIFLTATYRSSFTRYQSGGGLALAALIAVLSGYSAVLRGDISIAVSLHLILLLSSAAILPWSLACQFLVVLLCTGSMAWTVSRVGLSAPNQSEVLVLLNLVAGIVLSMALSAHTRRSFDRGVRENLRLRAAEQHNRNLNEGLEAKVRARTSELEGILEDQRAMTRAISHDLRQPLRHIEGYARMLEDDLGGKLDPDSLERLDRVRLSTVRVGRMVDSLLALTRVSGRLVERHEVDLGAVADRIVDELARSEPGREVQFVHEPDLVDHCDPALVRDLLRELLVNAWKFTRERPAPRVELGRRGKTWFVRDDGAGFSMQHTGRLFHAFERLHHVAEFEGEGMGLAIAARIVRSHGGRIWAESEPGEGATFYFTLHGESGSA